MCMCVCANVCVGAVMFVTWEAGHGAAAITRRTFTEVCALSDDVNACKIWQLTYAHEQ